MYCLTTLKKLCCRCVMGYSFFGQNGRYQRQHAWPFGVARLQSIQRVSPASPDVFSASHLQQHLQKESLIHSNIWNKLDEKSVSAKSLKRFKRQLQRLHTDGLFPTPVKSALVSAPWHIPVEVLTGKIKNHTNQIPRILLLVTDFWSSVSFRWRRIWPYTAHSAYWKVTINYYLKKQQPHQLKRK